MIVVGGAAQLNGWIKLLEERLVDMKVRFGSLHKDILAVEKERPRINDFIQAIAILNAGKEDCTKTPVNSTVVERPAPEPEEEEEIIITPATKEEKPKRRNIFSTLFDKFGKIIEEGEQDDEN